MYFTDEVPSTWPAQAMWQQNFDPDPSLRHRIIDTCSAYPPLYCYPGWRLTQYLPLVRGEGDDAPSYITVYCNHTGTTGIGTGDGSRRLIGSRGGVPVTFWLGPSEHIIQLSLCTTTIGGYLYGPFLLVSTNLLKFQPLGHLSAFLPPN